MNRKYSTVLLFFASLLLFTGCPNELTLDTTDPVPGGSGTITASNVATTSLDLTWTKAVDDTSTQAALAYRVYYSTSDNIDTVANAEANGTPFGSASADISSVSVTGLDASTTYYFNVVVSDGAGNKAVYITVSQATATPADTTNPVPGNSGTVTTSNVTTASVDLAWTKATDDTSAQAALAYRVYYSTSDNIDTVANAEANGTAFGSASADISSVSVTGLTPSTTYYFNVVVSDGAGNKAVYITVSQATATPADTTNPVPGGSGTVTTSNVTTASVDLAWTKATDDTSAQAALAYRVYYSTSNNIGTVSNAESNGTSFGSAVADISSVSVTGLDASTTYYFNVVVSDEAGNKAIYTTVSQATATPPDTTNPVPGGSGTVTTSNITTASVDLAWTKATDDTSAQAALAYRVYYSTSDNIDTVANAEANGTAFGSASADISSVSVTGLTDSTTYYFNVIVSDEAGNKAIYTTVSETTLTAAKIYWTDYENNRIQRANLDGTSPETVVTGADSSGGGPISVAVYDGYIYWIGDTQQGIKKSALETGIDGSVITPIVSAAATVYTIDVDETNSKIYWTDYENNAIKRANLDGTSPETVVTGADSSGGGPIAVVVYNGYIYWIGDTQQGIKKSAVGTGIDGSGITPIISASATVYSMDVDETNNKIYWTDYEGNAIKRANLDGTSVETVATDADGSGGGALSLAVDDLFIYWIGDTEQGIKKSALGTGIDGSLLSPIVAAGATVYGITVE